MILEVVLQQNLRGNTIVNRWNYVSSGTPVGVTNSQALLTAMGAVYNLGTSDFPADTIVKAIAAMQSADVSFVQMYARNIYPGSDFYEIPYGAPVAGQIAGDSAPPFVAYGLSTTRVSTAVRRGQKRIAGIPNSYVVDGGILDTTAFGLAEDLAELMTDTLSYTDGGNSLSFVPTIIQKKEYETPAGNRAYEYWPTEVEQLAHLAQGFTWFAKEETRSQTSRQYGRGA